MPPKYTRSSSDIDSNGASRAGSPRTGEDVSTTSTSTPGGKSAVSVRNSSSASRSAFSRSPMLRERSRTIMIRPSPGIAITGPAAPSSASPPAGSATTLMPPSKSARCTSRVTTSSEPIARGSHSSSAHPSTADSSSAQLPSPTPFPPTLVITRSVRPSQYTLRRSESAGSGKPSSDAMTWTRSHRWSGSPASGAGTSAPSDLNSCRRARIGKIRSRYWRGPICSISAGSTWIRRCCRYTACAAPRVETRKESARALSGDVPSHSPVTTADSGSVR